MSDLISRQAVYEVLNQLYDNDCFAESERDIGWNNAIANMKLEIAELPSAEPERKTSRWGYMLIDGSIMCLNCGTRYDWDSQAQYYKYCPNCGSRMMEANQDE